MELAYGCILYIRISSKISGEIFHMGIGYHHKKDLTKPNHILLVSFYLNPFKHTATGHPILNIQLPIVNNKKLGNVCYLHVMCIFS